MSLKTCVIIFKKKNPPSPIVSILPTFFFLDLGEILKIDRRKRGGKKKDEYILVFFFLYIYNLSF